MAENRAYDKVAHASLNGIFVKAQELDRGQNDTPAPPCALPGMRGGVRKRAFAPMADERSDAETRASAHTYDAETHASDAETHASDRA